MIKEYSKWSATEVAQKIRAKEVSASEVLKTAISEIEEKNQRLNAVTYKMYDEAEKLLAKAEVDAPFYGVPFLLKDIGLAYEGHPLTASCQALKNYRPDYSSELALRYLRAGFVFLGRTNVPECGLKGVTDSKMHGACRNPWNSDYTPGGSSGGAAAAVASGMVPVAHGSDGGGSIRIPASCCGLIGLKPSRGRMPTGPRAGDGWMGQVADHVLAKSVTDSAQILDLTHGIDSGAPYSIPRPKQTYSSAIQKPLGKKKIAFSKDSLFGKGTHPECMQALEKSIKFCEDLGHEVIEAKPEFDAKEMTQAYMTVVAGSMTAELREVAKLLGRPIRANDMELASWVLGLIGTSLDAGDMAQAVLVSRKMSRELGRFFQTYDYFMLPTMAYPPTKIGQLDFGMKDQLLMQVLRAVPVKKLLLKALDHIVEESFEYCPNTELFNQTGSPAISLPLHLGENNLPIGIQFVSAYGREDLLLQIAKQFEDSQLFTDMC